MAKLFRGLIVAGLLLSVWLLGSGRDAGALESNNFPPTSGQLSRHSPAQRGRVVRTAAKAPKKKARTKKGAPKKSEMDKDQSDEMKADTPKAEAKPAAAAAPAADDGKSLKFARDVAPTIAGACVRCHNPKDKAKRNNLDMTTFAALMKGGDSGAAVVPGKPEESELIKRVKHESTPKMPPGQNDLADVTIAKLETWIKDGAVLDAGLDPKAPIASYAMSADQKRREELAKLKPEEREKLAETTALDRWKKGAPGQKPEATTSAHFVLLGTLPKDRATAALKLVEAKYGLIKQLVGMNDPPLKISVLAFNDVNSFVEFARNAEGREVEPGDRGSAKFDGLDPYVAVVDPLGGREDLTAHSKPSPKRGKTKDADEPAGPERTLPGIVVEHMAIGAAQAAGKPPSWLTLGLGAYLASQVEGKSPYIVGLRRSAFDQFEQGWTSRAVDALGGTAKTEEIRAVGFGIVDWLGTTSARLLPPFIRGMLGGQEKLDDVIQNVFAGTREQFLSLSGEYVGSRYGGGRRR